MRMDQSQIENIVRRRNAKLLANSTRGWSSSARARLEQPASPEALAAVLRTIDAGMRNHRAR